MPSRLHIQVGNRANNAGFQDLISPHGVGQQLSAVLASSDPVVRMRAIALVIGLGGQSEVAVKALQQSGVLSLQTFSSTAITCASLNVCIYRLLLLYMHCCMAASSQCILCTSWVAALQSSYLCIDVKPICAFEPTQVLFWHLNILCWVYTDNAFSAGCNSNCSICNACRPAAATGEGADQ